MVESFFLDTDYNSNFYLLPFSLKEQWLQDISNSYNFNMSEHKELEDKYEQYRLPDSFDMSDLSFENPVIEE